MRQISALLLLLLFFTLTGCATVGHQEAGIDNFDRVTPTLYRGAQPSEQGIRTLSQMRVKTIINLRDSDDALEAQQVHNAGMTYIHLPLDAETVTVADAEKFLSLLSTAPTPVFVHCMVGRDRTGMAVAAYRVVVDNWTAQAAIQEMNDHGHFWLFFPKVRNAVAALAQHRPDLAAKPAGPILAAKTDLPIALPVTVAR